MYAGCAQDSLIEGAFHSRASWSLVGLLGTSTWTSMLTAAFPHGGSGPWTFAIDQIVTAVSVLRTFLPFQSSV